MRVFETVCSTAWAIQEESLRTILEIAGRDEPLTEAQIEAVAAKIGRPLDNTRSVTVRDGIATIPITGPLFRYANMFTRISGATSLEVLGTDFGEALRNPQVAAIVLEIDSPGGEVTGIDAFSELVAGARGTKPVIAYVGGLGASAAYWIASAADQIVVSPAAMVGSIGVVMAFRKSDDPRRVELVSSQSPDKRPDLDTDAGRAKVQATIDSIAQVFVQAVASNRGVTAETVLTDFGAGGVLVGADAVAAGMADEVGTLEGLLATVRDRLRAGELVPGQYRRYAHGSRQAEQENSMTLWDRLKAALGGIEAEAEAPPAAPAPAPAPVPAPAATAEIEALKAELAKSQRENAERAQRELRTAAEAFAASEVASKRALPAEAAEMIAAYVEASEDDAARPIAGDGKSRVERLKARASARTPHQLTEEQLKDGAPEGAVALANKQETERATPPGEEPANPKPMKADRKAALLAATPLGRVVAKAEKESK